jgi:DNA-binding NarL/FixJ family response regulator
MRRQCLLPVILVGKSILLKEGLARILRASNFRILASIASADDFLPSKSAPQPPLCLIVHTGDDFDVAVEQIELFKGRFPDGRVAIVADQYRLNDLTAAFRAGANGYFVNVITCDRFVKSVELVMLGETIFPPAFLSFILDATARLADAATHDRTDEEHGEPILLATEDPNAPLLSPREKSILLCIIEGDSNKCIARKMDITEATVKVHVKAILRKIRVQNRTQAAIWGLNHGPRRQLENGARKLPIPSINPPLVNHLKAISEVKALKPPELQDEATGKTPRVHGATRPIK